MTPQLIAFILYFVAVLGIGLVFFFKSKGGGEKEYFLGGRSMGPWVTALSAQTFPLAVTMSRSLTDEHYILTDATFPVVFEYEGEKMSYKVNLNVNECLAMDPLELAELLMREMSFEIPTDVETRENNKLASETITKATAYAAYFTDMETKARLMKRTAKANKNKDEFDRLIGVEEVFKSCKEIAKLQIENVAKIMTLRRLALEEQKNNDRIT
jgi:hypothetical protein